jgi:ABC-type phosphate/phosphonate transport system substrate-binding protein
MIGVRIAAVGVVALTAGLLSLPPTPAAQNELNQARAVRIGLVGTLFRDVPPATAQMSLSPFRALMHAQTGLNGELLTVPNALALGQQLHEDKLDFGVFHGVEFAWAQEKHADLLPLVIAINRHRELRALLVGRNDCQATDFPALKGKAVALPRRSREHCHLFLERACLEQGSTPKAFFAEVVEHSSVEAALDDVVRGKVPAAVVDGVSLEFYEQEKPGCFARLKTLRQSPVFPAAVVAYHRGALDEATLNRFRDGMISANQNTRSRELMVLWKLTAFEPIPAGYQQTLTSIRKAYPAPSSSTTGNVSSP